MNDPSTITHSDFPRPRALRAATSKRSKTDTPPKTSLLARGVDGEIPKQLEEALDKIVEYLQEASDEEFEGLKDIVGGLFGVGGEWAGAGKVGERGVGVARMDGEGSVGVECDGVPATETELGCKAQGSHLHLANHPHTHPQPSLASSNSNSAPNNIYPTPWALWSIAPSTPTRTPDIPRLEGLYTLPTAEMMAWTMSMSMSRYAYACYEGREGCSCFARVRGSGSGWRNPYFEYGEDEEVEEVVSE